MNDTDRIARTLRASGEVSPLDYDGSRVIFDDGKPIKRMAARIKELREQGWRIRTDERDGMALYTLIAEPGKPPVANPAGESDDEFFDRTVPPVDAVIAEWESAA